MLNTAEIALLLNKKLLLRTTLFSRGSSCSLERIFCKKDIRLWIELLLRRIHPLVYIDDRLPAAFLGFGR